MQLRVATRTTLCQPRVSIQFSTAHKRKKSLVMTFYLTRVFFLMQSDDTLLNDAALQSRQPRFSATILLKHDNYRCAFGTRNKSFPTNGECIKMTICLCANRRLNLNLDFIINHIMCISLKAAWVLKVFLGISWWKIFRKWEIYCVIWRTKGFV